MLKTVRAMMVPGGWFVLRCTGGSTASILLNSRIKYDLLLFDSKSQGVSGIEMVRLARSLERRAGTPIILLSLTACEIEGLRIGADKIMRKHEHLHALPEMIRHQLVTEKSKAQSRASGV